MTAYAYPEPASCILHLGRRRDSDDGHGRVTQRHEVEIVGFVRRTDAADGPATPMPCSIVDISFGGTRLTCATPIGVGVHLQLDVFLDDGIAEPFSVACEVRWVEVVPEGHQIGLHFGDLPEQQSQRLEQAIRLIQGTCFRLGFLHWKLATQLEVLEAMGKWAPMPSLECWVVIRNITALR